MPGFNLQKSLAARAAVIAFAAAFIAIVAASSLFRIADRQTFGERRYGDVRTVMLAAIDPRFQNKADEIARVAERMVVIGAVKGGALFDDSGHLQQSFGEQTRTSFQTMLATGATIFRDADADRLEFYYPPDVSRTPFHILLRVDAGEITALETLRQTRTLLLGLIVGLATALVVALAYVFLVVAPLRRINAALEQTLTDPANADGGPPLRAGRTEVGQTAQAVEFLRSTLADLWRNKVLVADGILETAPFALVQLNTEGVPVFANAACVDLFERDIVHTTVNNPPVVVDVASGEQRKLRAFVEAFGEAERLVEVPTAGGRDSRFALASSRVVGADGRAPTTIVIAADVTGIEVARRESLAARSRGEEDLRLAAAREFELKLMLESCLALMAGSEGSDAHLDATPFAREWLDSAHAVGLVGDVTLPEEGPLIAGGQENLRIVIRLALTSALARAGSAPADISVDLRGINFETAGLEIAVRPGGAGPRRPITVDPNLALAALRAAVRRVGGQLGELTAADGGCLLRLTLRGAAERVSTGMKSEKR